MDIIYQRQPRRLQGAVSAQPFAHKAKVRRNAGEIDIDQALRMSPWFQIAKVSLKVDRERVNWRGFAYQPLEDSRPRLVKR